MTPEREKKIRDGWTIVNGPEGGTVMSQEFAAEHFDELLAQLNRLRETEATLRHELKMMHPQYQRVKSLLQECRHWYENFYDPSNLNERIDEALK